MTAAESRVSDETERYVEELLAAASPLSASQAELIKVVMGDARAAARTERGAAS